jgi:hypothetical protein
MKKHVIFLLAATALLLVGCGRGQKFTVQGTMKDTGFPAADSVKIEYEMMKAPLRSAVKDGAFSIKGRVEKPVFAKVSTLGAERRHSVSCILEKGDISFRKGLAYGTPLNDSTEAFTLRISQTAKKYSGQKEAQVKAIENEFAAFVSRHANDPCAIYAIMFGNHKLRAGFLRELIASTSPEIRNNGEIHSLEMELRIRAL